MLDFEINFLLSRNPVARQRLYKNNPAATNTYATTQGGVLFAVRAASNTKYVAKGSMRLIFFLVHSP
jgi:hypothetical protein